MNQNNNQNNRKKNQKKNLKNDQKNQLKQKLLQLRKQCNAPYAEKLIEYTSESTGEGKFMAKAKIALPNKIATYASLGRLGKKKVAERNAAQVALNALNQMFPPNSLSPTQHNQDRFEADMEATVQLFEDMTISTKVTHAQRIVQKLKPNTPESEIQSFSSCRKAVEGLLVNIHDYIDAEINNKPVYIFESFKDFRTDLRTNRNRKMFPRLSAKTEGYQILMRNL